MPFHNMIIFTSKKLGSAARKANYLQPIFVINEH